MKLIGNARVWTRQLSTDRQRADLAEGRVTVLVDVQSCSSPFP